MRARFILAALLVVALAGPASARVQLKSSYPTHGDLVMFREPFVELEFTDPIAEAFVTITDPEGREIVAPGAPKIVGVDVTVPIRSPVAPHGLVAGEYVVTWFVKTLAGETRRDSFRFEVMQH